MLDVECLMIEVSGLHAALFLKALCAFSFFIPQGYEEKQMPPSILLKPLQTFIYRNDNMYRTDNKAEELVRCS